MNFVLFSTGFARCIGPFKENHLQVHKHNIWLLNVVKKSDPHQDRGKRPIKQIFSSIDIIYSSSMRNVGMMVLQRHVQQKWSTLRLYLQKIIRVHGVTWCKSHTKDILRKP